MQEFDLEEVEDALRQRIQAESPLMPVVVETLNVLTTLSSAHMAREVVGTIVARLATAGGSLRRWLEIVDEFRRVLLCRVIDEDLNREDGEGGEFDFDGNNTTD